MLKTLTLSILFLLSTSWTFAETQPLALVYAGPGVCDGCETSLAATIHQSGFRVQLIRAGEISSEILSKASIFAVPGGEEEADVKNALFPGEAERIRDFVNRGGSYLGVCLGAYLAANWMSDRESQHGLQLFDGEIRNHSPTKEARMEDVTWQGHHRWLYFQDGPEFSLSASSTNPTDIWAYYKTGAIAALQTKFGTGRVGLIGPHLEADQTWWDEDHLVDPDGLDGDLMPAFLQSLIAR